MATLFDDYGNYIGPELPLECVHDCSGPGERSEDVKFWAEALGFTVPRELAIRHLRGYGAWSEDELNDTDDETLAHRVLWLACCDIRENGDWFGLVD
jgi:hypothetical protein